MTIVRTDAENKRLLDEAMPTYEALRRDSIREESNEERLIQAQDEKLKQSVASFGTANLEELERALAEAQLRNTEATDRFLFRVDKSFNDAKSAGVKS